MALTRFWLIGWLTINTKRFIDQDFLGAYKWLSHKMDERVNGRIPSCSWPIWGWYQYSNSKEKMPDLRRSWHLPTGTHGIRLCLELPFENLLLSDFNHWHEVLNASANNEYDFNNPIPTKIDKRWKKKILLNKDDLQKRRVKNRAIQATFWQIKIDQVIKKQEFIAR